MTPTLLLVAAYFIVLAGLSAAAMPYRRRMRELGAELCAMDLNSSERLIVEGMLRHAYSWRMAVVLFLVYVAGLFQAGSALDREAERAAQETPHLSYNPIFHRFSEAFFASVIGVNPVFGLFAIFARLAFRLKARLHHNSKAARHLADIRQAHAI